MHKTYPCIKLSTVFLSENGIVLLLMSVLGISGLEKRIGFIVVCILVLRKRNKVLVKMSPSRVLGLGTEAGE